MVWFCYRCRFFSGVVGVASIQLWEIVFGVVLAWPPWDYNNVYYQNLELPLMVVNVLWKLLYLLRNGN
jgi:hypothetical protein